MDFAKEEKYHRQKIIFRRSLLLFAGIVELLLGIIFYFLSNYVPVASLVSVILIAYGIYCLHQRSELSPDMPMWMDKTGYIFLFQSHENDPTPNVATRFHQPTPEEMEERYRDLLERGHLTQEEYDRNAGK